LQQQGIPILQSLGEIKSYQQLRQQLRQQMQLYKMPRVFIKLKYGSAGVGIMALETHGTKIQVKTTLEVQQNKNQLALYNSRRLCFSRNEKEIALWVGCTLSNGGTS